MEPGSDEWDNKELFKDIKPCLFRDGKFFLQLQKNNFEEINDYFPLDLSKFSDRYDVMIEFPKIGIKFTQQENFLDAEITNNPDMQGFSYNAYSFNTEGDREKLYLSAFLMNNMRTKNNSLNSISTSSPSINNSSATCYYYLLKSSDLLNFSNITNGYLPMNYYQLMLIQVLYLIKYKTFKTKTTTGTGHTYIVSNSNRYFNIGSTLKNPWNFYKTNTDRYSCKLFGLEDIIGGINCFVGGIYLPAKGNNDFSWKFHNSFKGNTIIEETTENWNNTKKEYNGYYRMSNLYIENFFATNDLGFTPSKAISSCKYSLLNEIRVTSDENCYLMLKHNDSSIFDMNFNLSKDFTTTDKVTARMACLV